MSKLIKCSICNSEDVFFIQEYKGSSKLFEEKQLFECKNCSFVFCEPLPEDKELEDYNSQYFLNAHGGFSEDPLVLSYHSAINKLRVEHVLEYAKIHKIELKQIFEIGPGTGMFFKHFIDKNPNAEYSILESDLKEREKFKNKVTNTYNDFDEIPKEKFDLVICSHVLEHTNKPKFLVGHLVSLLKRNGILFVEVPCRDYIYKSNFEPHLLFFNAHSFSTLLSQFQLNKNYISAHGPDVIEPKILKKLRLYMQLFFRLLYKLRLTAIVKFFFINKKRKFTSNELISILPYRFLPEKKKESWWLRSVSIKN